MAVGSFRALSLLRTHPLTQPLAVLSHEGSVLLYDHVR